MDEADIILVFEIEFCDYSGYELDDFDNIKMSENN